MSTSTIISHGIAYGGVISSPNPAETKVTINTLGSNLLVAFYVGDAEHGNEDVLMDSKGNSWNKLPSDPPGDYNHGFTTGSCSFYWCSNPTTAAAHEFVVTTANPGQAHSCLQVTAVGNLTSPNYTNQKFATDTASSAVNIGALTVSGLVFTCCALGTGDMSANYGVPTLVSAGWTVLDTLQAIHGLPFDWGNCGLVVAYKLVASPTSTSVNYTYTGGGSGAGLTFAFSYSAATSTFTPGSGIYKIIPGQDFDELMLNSTPDTMKVPIDANATTALLGDE